MVPQAPVRCRLSLTVETEEGLAVERRPQAQRLGSWCTICIPTIGTSLVTQTKKNQGLASEQRPQAQRLGSWCTVASLKLATISSRRRRKGSPRIDAQKPNALDPGVQSHPSSWPVSHHAEEGLASYQRPRTYLSSHLVEGLSSSLLVG